jgi:microcystin-dependent protein
MTLYKWSMTAANNATADSSINWAEGQAPSSVNDSARAEMAAVAKFRDDISGAITTGGSATAYTVTSSQGFNSLANMSGKMIAFVPHTTSGATVTLNVDGLGAKPLRSAPSAELSAGVLVQGTPYVATYSNATQEWLLHGFYGDPYSIPLGGMLEFTGPTAPNSSFVLPFGQAISRTAYAAYFAMVGTTYGVGDGSTTFNVIDKRGRVSAGKDDMGGSAINRITNAGSGIIGTTLGAAGGAENVTLAQANLPNVALNVTIPAGQGSHVHQYFQLGAGPGDLSQTGGAGGGNSNTGAATLPQLTGSTASINGAVTQTALNKMPPAIIVNYILRIL